MVKKFKAHPLMIFTFLKPFLFVLVIPLISGLVQYVKYRTFDNVLRMEIFLFLVILFIAILRWNTFSLICNTKDSTVTVKSGILFRRIAKISVSKLSSVQTAKNPIDAVFFAVTYRINTEAGMVAKSDFEFKLSNKNSAEVSSLLYGENTCEPIKFSAIRVAILAATTSSAFTGMVLWLPMLNSAANLLGLAISDMLNEISNVSAGIKNYFPPIVNTISLIILFSYFVSFVHSFLKYINFKLYLQEDKLEVRSGFFVRLRTSFKKKAINDIRIEQTPIMMLLRRFAMKVNVGGYSDKKGESEIIIPLGANKEIKKRFAEYFSFFLPNQEGFKPNNNLLTKSRFLCWPTYYLIAVIVIAIILSLRFTEFTWFIFFLTCVASVFILCYAYICLFEFNCGTIKFGDNIFLCSSKGLRTCEMYCPKENVGEIRLIRFPPDMIYKTCRVRVFIRSECADSLRVRHLDYNSVKNEIYKCFNIE